MTQENAKAQGVFLPNWWLAILLMPLAGGVIWVVITLTRIQEQQSSLKDTIEFRLKSTETQTRLNDEHTRQLEIEIAKTQGAVEAIAKFQLTSKKEN